MIHADRDDPHDLPIKVGAPARIERGQACLLEVPVAVCLAAGCARAGVFSTVAIRHVAEVTAHITTARKFPRWREAAIGSAFVAPPVVSIADAAIEPGPVRVEGVAAVV